MDPVTKARQSSANSGKKRGRVENLKPWKPGQSGNPEGRPKKRPITEIYEEILADPKNRASLKDQIINTITSRGMAGVLERREMKESIEGKVTQPVEVDGEIKFTLAEVIKKARLRAIKK